MNISTKAIRDLSIIYHTARSFTLRTDRHAMMLERPSRINATLMRILVISNVVPYPPHSGMKLRILHLLKRVALQHEVTLCSHAWSHADEDQARVLSQYGIRIFTGAMHPRIDLEKLSAAARFGLSARPPELALYRSKHLTATLRDLFRAETFDILQIEEPILAHYADFLPRGSTTKRLLTFHDIHFVQSARAAALEQSIGLSAWRRFNRPALGRRSQWCRYPSAASAARAGRFAHHRVRRQYVL
jgi:hypothetical protein